ncbi:MAG: 30S ribosomal protein S1 [Dissulfurispiraceae bacterium]
MDMQTKEETKDFEKFYANAVHKIERGDITSGKIVALKNDGVVVDIGYKSEGTISLSEFTEKELADLHEGNEIEVYIERINDHEGVITLSKDKASKIRAWEVLRSAHENNSVIQGKVTDKTKGGLLVDVMGIKAFLPVSQIDVKGLKEIDSYVGETIPLKILKLIPPKPQSDFYASKTSTTSLVVSRRAVIEDERSKKKVETLKTLVEGAILKGVVKNITDYGVFVDLGGIDGLLHISDISWGRVNHPSEFFFLGDEKEFTIIKYEPATEKITLGYKQKKPDPWLSVGDSYRQGMKLKGKVVTITDYGVFIEIEEGLEGLIHISEIDWAPRPKHPSKYFSVGDEVEAMVLNVNKDERRLSLSINQLKPKPWELVGQRYAVGQKVKGRVKTLTDFGAFIRLQEGVDGLVHISDLSWTKHVKHPSDVLSKGQRIEALVLSLEPEKERIALGIKQLVSDPWKDEIPAKFRLGDELQGKILRITDFGIFVELEGGVEGLVYSSEVDPSKTLQEGDEIMVKIIKVNAEERKIGLSMKNLRSHEA